jgi:hypothetical protein
MGLESSSMPSPVRALKQRSSRVAAMLPAQLRVAARRTWLQANRQASTFRCTGPRSPPIAALARRCPRCRRGRRVSPPQLSGPVHDASDLPRLHCACTVLMQLTACSLPRKQCAFGPARKKRRDLAERPRDAHILGEPMHPRLRPFPSSRALLCQTSSALASNEMMARRRIPMALRRSASHNCACLWRVSKKTQGEDAPHLGVSYPATDGVATPAEGSSLRT